MTDRDKIAERIEIVCPFSALNIADYILSCLPEKISSAIQEIAVDNYRTGFNSAIDQIKDNLMGE